MNHKLNKALFKSLNESIRVPFIVIDHKGKVLSCNEEAKSLFSFEDDEVNFLELLTPDTSSHLSEYIQQAFEKQKNIFEDISVVLKKGDEFNIKTSISIYKEENEIFVFLSFIEQNYNIGLTGTTTIQIKSTDIFNIIKNKEIIEILEEVKSLYPFTFIGREKLLKKINQLEEFFWIKDIKGNFIVANNKIAISLGVKLSQLEGKKVESFLPPYLVEFNKSVDKYIQDSLNFVVMEGLPIFGIISQDEYQTIIIPLTDSDNKVIATIGIAQKIDGAIKAAAEDFFVKEGLNLIANVPKAIAFIDKIGIIKHGSKEFCKLFSVEFTDFGGFYFTKALPIKISEKVRQFYNSNLDFEKFESEVFIEGGQVSLSNYIFYLNKIYNKEKEFEGISLLVENSIVEDDLEKLLNKRGRMFEILIQNNPEPMFIYDTENLRFIEVNDAALALYGYRKDEFLQMDLTDLYTPEDIQTLLDSSNLSAKQGKFSGPFKQKKKDGSYVFVKISKISFKYKDKDAHFNVIKNVTDQLALEKKNQIFKTAFENTDDLLFLTDNIGIITFVNNSVYKILGYARGELESSSFTSLVKDEERGTINSSIFQSYLKDSVTVTVELKMKDGNFIEVELTANPILDYKSEVESFSIIAKVPQKNFSEPKEIIKEVIVEKPIAVGISQPGSFNENFLSNLFHEILTPINVILGFVQELTEGLESLSPEQKQSIEIINQNRGRLLNTMNSFIEYAEIQKNNFEINPEETSITEVIDKIHNNYKEIVGANKNEFAYGRISSSLKFETDKDKFQNLIGLLIKIVSSIVKGKKIYFSSYQLDGDTFFVSIKDSYSSISQTLFDAVVSLFQNEDASLIKDIDISKLTFRLVKSLLLLLGGRFEVLEKGPDKYDYGFVFPLLLSKTLEKLKDTKIQQTPVNNIVEVPNEQQASERGVETEVDLQKEESAKLLEEEDLNKLPYSEIVENETEEVNEEEITDEETIEEESKEEKFGEEINDNEAVSTGENLNINEQVNEEIIKELPAPKPVETGKTFRKKNEKINLKELTCLYIEDQVDSQILFKVQMKELKDIKYAVSFEEALPLLDNFHFDFIVMDINLQGEYNGLDALKIIHKMPRYESIPIIAVTAYVLPGDKEKFIATGFNDFISKPIFREKMMDSLEKIFLMHV